MAHAYSVQLSMSSCSNKREGWVPTKQQAKTVSNYKAYLENLKLQYRITNVAPEDFQKSLSILQEGMRDGPYSEYCKKVPDVLPATQGAYANMRTLFQYLLWGLSFFKNLRAELINGDQAVLSKPVVVAMGGHDSETNPPVVCDAINQQISGLSKIELTRGIYKLLGITWLVQKLKVVFINRTGSLEEKSKSLANLQQRLKEGMHAGVFVEGTCNPVPGKIGVCKPGVLAVASGFELKDSPAPIIPALFQSKGTDPCVILGKPIDPRVLREQAKILTGDLQRVTFVDKSKTQIYYNQMLSRIQCLLVRELILRLNSNYEKDAGSELSEFNHDAVIALLKLETLSPFLFFKVVSVKKEADIRAAQPVLDRFFQEQRPSINTDFLKEAIQSFMEYRTALHR